jgi:hypothetical protein
VGYRNNKSKWLSKGDTTGTNQNAYNILQIFIIAPEPYQFMVGLRRKYFNSSIIST